MVRVFGVFPLFFPLSLSFVVLLVRYFFFVVVQPNLSKCVCVLVSVHCIAFVCLRALDER